MDRGCRNLYRFGNGIFGVTRAPDRSGGRDSNPTGIEINSKSKRV